MMITKIRVSRRGLVGLLGLVGGPAALMAQTPLKVIDAKASSSQVAYLGPQNLLSNDGLTEDPPKSGKFRLSKSALNYTSGYASPNDESPVVHFDFGSVKTVDRFRVWNSNEPSYSWRGFRDVTVQFSNDAIKWTTVPERMVFAKAPGTDSYFGELMTFARPITARFIRFCANSTWRNFPQPDVAGLGRVRFYEGGKPTPLPTETGDFPIAAGVVDVTAAPYNIRPDGKTDCTAALQKAILDWQGRDRVIYLPKGIYLVSSTIRFSSNTTANRNGLYGRHHLLGAGSANTQIRLKDGVFTSIKNFMPLVAFGVISFWNGQYDQTTADWFNNTFAGITINTGRGNLGAKGIEFFSNNTGAMRDVVIRSEDGRGEVGLDLGHADLNGPLLVKGLTVQGFKVGVNTGGTVNSQTFENITLQDQTVVGLKNNGQCLSIRGLTTKGAVPALQSAYGFVTLIDGQFTGTGNATNLAAVESGEFLVARDLKSSGFKSLIKNTNGNGPNVTASTVSEYLSTTPTLSLFPTDGKFLRLPVVETPVLTPVSPRSWANIRDFRLTTEMDDAPAFQRAVDSGAEVLYFPADAQIVLRKDVFVRGKVKLVLGLHAQIQSMAGVKVRISDSTTPVVRFERFKGIGIVQPSNRSLVVADAECSVTGTGTGRIFLENVGGDFAFERNSVWARQLNAEAEGLKITNTGGNLWVLGFKTERAGTLVKTLAGGSTEILGGLCYTTTTGKDPMFEATDSALGVTIGEVSYGPPPYGTLVKQTIGKTVKSLVRGQAPFRFSFMNGSAIPLFRANKK